MSSIVGQCLVLYSLYQARRQSPVSITHRTPPALPDSLG